MTQDVIGRFPVCPQYTAKEHKEKFLHIDACKDGCICRSFPDATGIDDALSKTYPFGLHSGKCIESLTDIVVGEICHCERVVDDASDNTFLFPVEIKVKPCAKAS